MSKQYYIKMNGERIPVDEVVYREFLRPIWRENKRKKKRKKLERSRDAMLENGKERKATPTQHGVDEIITDKLLINALLDAITVLDEDERNMIYALFFKGQSERSYAEETGVPRKTLAYRKGKVLKKLRKIIEKN